MAVYSLVETDGQLEKLCRELTGSNELALDLEADSLHHYREKVCLVQLSSRDKTWVIDPLKITSLAPLGNLVAKPSLLAVFHGGDYDIRSLHRDFGITVARMFDTMIAAQFLGETEFGLAALLKAHFGVELDKRFQKADWSRRPLTPEMADYASEDTVHLLPLADLLTGRLKELGRQCWVEEECALVAGNRMTEKSGTPLFMNCKGAGKLDRRGLAVLEELLQFRDQQARAADRPPFKIISSESLLYIAEKKTDQVQNLNKVPGITPRLVERYGAKLISAVNRAMSLPGEELPVYPRSRIEQSAGSKKRLALLKSWREERSKSVGLSSGLFAPNWLLERIAEHSPDSVEKLQEIPGVRRWQAGLWGEEAVSILVKERLAT